MNKGKVIVGIIVVMLIIAVVVGALAAFTDIFKKNPPADKLEYKAIANGDEVSTLYFNTSREITNFDVFTMSIYGEMGNISPSESVTVTHRFSYANKKIFVYFDSDSFVYNRFALWLYVGEVGSDNAKRILLYSQYDDKENDIKRGWQFDKIDLAKFVAGEKITADFGERALALQDFVGQFISANGAFIEEV